jgi:DNA-binding winged helix-turn-helix (wHTH) protein
MGPPPVAIRRLVYRFGPFTLDPGQRRLSEGEARVFLADRPMDVLLCLVAHAGQVVEKDALIRAAWRDTAVTDDSLRQAVKDIRRTLRRPDDGGEYIETHVRRGLAFTAPVERIEEGPPPPSLEVLLDPYRAFVDGCAALETLHRDEVDRARAAFAHALRLEPGLSTAHIGLATADFLSFESTRADLTPDWRRLHEAEQHAREGCRLHPTSGDAWGTFALVRYRQGDTRDAIAAGRKATTLEPRDWRHYLRLAAVSWGGERQRAAERALALNPELALAHWLCATVFVARGAFDRALEQLRLGCALQEARRASRHPALRDPALRDIKNAASAGTVDVERFDAVGLYLLRGLVLAATGAVESALVELEGELATSYARHVYGRESLAHTWCAIGALRRRQGLGNEAIAAFRNAVTHVPGHPLARIVLQPMDFGTQTNRSAVLQDDIVVRDGEAQTNASAVDTAIARAVALALAQQHEEAARNCEAALRQAPPGLAGWALPVDPLLHVGAHPEAWASALALVRARAV